MILENSIPIFWDRKTLFLPMIGHSLGMRTVSGNTAEVFQKKLAQMDTFNFGWFLGGGGIFPPVCIIYFPTFSLCPGPFLEEINDYEPNRKEQEALCAQGGFGIANHSARATSNYWKTANERGKTYCAKFFWGGNLL